MRTELRIQFLGVMIACLPWGNMVTGVVLQGAEPPKSSVGGESEEQDLATAIPSWRSFDHWLGRSGIKLSEEQLKKIESLRKSLDPKGGAAVKSGETGGPGVEEQHAQWKMYQEGLSTILSPDQLQRLRRQWYQFRGLTVLGDEEVGHKLKLTEEQRKKIEESLNSYRSERQVISQETRKGGKEGRQRRRAKLSELRESRDKKLESVLTPEQRKLYDALGETNDEAGELLSAPKLTDDFIELGPATKIPPSEAESGTSSVPAK